MWQPCFDKTIIMSTYIVVYILMLTHNSSSMCYLGNTLEIKKNIYIYTFFMKKMQ